MDQNIFSKENRNNLIEKHKNFIHDTACNFCSKGLTLQQDQELNIALIAFNRACEAQKDNKGSFLSYAYILIRASLIDYYIKLPKTPTFIFDVGSKNFSDLYASLSDWEIFFDNEERAKEVAALSNELQAYSIKYRNLSRLEYADEIIRNKILNLVIKICKNETLKNEILEDKRFNADDLEELCEIDKTDLKKYKKYIIALLLIISCDKYVYLKGYIDIKVGDSSA